MWGELLFQQLCCPLSYWQVSENWYNGIIFTDISSQDHILTDNWQIAWSDVPLVGAFAVRVLTRVRFWGLALLSSLGAIFVNGAARQGKLAIGAMGRE